MAWARVRYQLKDALFIAVLLLDVFFTRIYLTPLSAYEYLHLGLLFLLLRVLINYMFKYLRCNVSPPIIPLARSPL